MKYKDDLYKRKSNSNGLVKKLYAITKKQSAAVADHNTYEESNGISRSLMIIIMVHVLAIGMWFFHNRHFASTEKPVAAIIPATKVTPAPTVELSKSSYLVQKGDDFTSIAVNHQVKESDLRNLNRNIQLEPNALIQIPDQKVSVQPIEIPEPSPMVETIAVATPEVIAKPIQAPDLTPKPVVKTTPAEKVVKKNTTPVAKRRHVVKSGDTLWSIASTYKSDQKSIMKANGIKDANKLSIGQTLNIP